LPGKRGLQTVFEAAVVALMCLEGDGVGSGVRGDGFDEGAVGRGELEVRGGRREGGREEALGDEFDVIDHLGLGEGRTRVLFHGNNKIMRELPG
jgi:hypothetical protein